ncbi:MAG: Holo-(acyl-carrier-protein) synthase [Tenericutes bacterium ADurb.BinA155]|jgi:phosphopantetheine--protein transferase-like protein|nr:MAG: Holo-(acyl-carrier-protein) synthase [Tenericutes bacterium ADurb.BinA155]
MAIGCDIVKMSRIKTDPDFVALILSEKEQAIYATRHNKIEFLAGHFAAKEAFLKALGTGLAGAPLKTIEILYQETGAPYIVYNKQQYAVSISHDGEYAMAVVTL